MKDKFIYKPRFKYLAIAVGVVGLLLAGFVYLLLSPPDIVLGGKRVLEYPVVYYGCLLIAVALAVLFLRMLRGSLRVKHNEGFINVSGGKVHWREFGKYGIMDVSFDIDDITGAVQGAGSDDFVVTTKDSSRHLFHQSFFDNQDEFLRFRRLLREGKIKRN